MLNFVFPFYSFLLYDFTFSGVCIIIIIIIRGDLHMLLRLKEMETGLRKGGREGLTIPFNAILGCLSHIHTEHDYLRSHGGHLIAKAVLELSIHVSCKGVLAI